METAQLALPTIATLALGAALLLPLRDDRSKDHAAHRTPGQGPLKAEFHAIEPNTVPGALDPLPKPAILRSVRSRVRTFRKRLAIFGVRPRPTGETSPITGPAFSLDADLDICFQEHVALRLPNVTEDGPFGSTPEAHARADGASIEHAVVSEDPEPLAVELAAESSVRPDALPLVVRPTRPIFDRVVPLTRLPLRSHANGITWFGASDPACNVATRAKRHAFLLDARRSPETTSVDLLCLAYREEDAEGRVLALRALARLDPARGTEIFIHALSVGTDEERAFAIDALLAAGAHSALIPAFSDRVEAIAAKAALAYVGTNASIDYRSALAPYLDGGRIEALLTLLAGYLT